MSVVRLIARDELRLMGRNRIGVIALAMVVLLTIIAIASSWSHRQRIADLRARHQSAAADAFDAQPDRHPHRVVHYGNFVFRPPGPLAAFDPGVDAFTGSSMFLEGHRQNTANFGDVRQGSLLVRFGQLTPAFVLQAVVPLLLVFLGFATVAREREHGTLRLLMLQGATRGQIVAGKLMALGGVACLAAIPAIAGLVAIAARTDGAALPAAVIGAGYLAYLLLWVIVILAVSALARRGRDALLALVAIWAVTTILVPRIAPEVASRAHDLRNRLQTDVAIARDLRRIGDSHDPDDPHFAAFKAATLRRYGASRIEDLPINYKGLLALEGERMTAALFDRYSKESFAAQERQNAMVGAAAILSPAIAVRSLSMSAAGTDLAGHRRFLDQAETYRYTLVQRLNRLQAGGVRYADDTASDAGADRRKRIDAAHWRAIPDFAFRQPEPGALARAALPYLASILCWLAGAAALLALAANRLGARR